MQSMPTLCPFCGTTLSRVMLDDYRKCCSCNILFAIQHMTLLESERFKASNSQELESWFESQGISNDRPT